ncbi:MAG TPA: hypothetical protein VFI33_09490 [Puia sp.]|nr:hypothetical protein [Puia sp.]
MQNPELRATIVMLEVQLNYYEKQLDKSIRDNEVFAKTKKVLTDLKEVSGKLEYLKKIHAAGINSTMSPVNIIN